MIKLYLYHNFTGFIIDQGGTYEDGFQISGKLLLLFSRDRNTSNPVHINVMASTFIYKHIINSVHRNAMAYTLIKTIMY